MFTLLRYIFRRRKKTKNTAPRKQTTKSSSGFIDDVAEGISDAFSSLGD